MDFRRVHPPIDTVQLQNKVKLECSVSAVVTVVVQVSVVHSVAGQNLVDLRWVHPPIDTVQLQKKVKLEC